MESKVILYDAKDKKIGQTFARRARQLVKQQRATWVDDQHEAIRFAPGMEHLDISNLSGLGEDGTEEADTALMKLAKRRVYAKFAFNLHRVIVICICILGLYFKP